MNTFWTISCVQRNILASPSKGHFGNGLRKRAHAPKEIKPNFHRKIQSREAAYLIAETNNITTHSRTVLSMQLGIEPHKMFKVRDPRARFRGGETTPREHEGCSEIPSKLTLPTSPTAAIIAMSLHLLQP